MSLTSDIGTSTRWRIASLTVPNGGKADLARSWIRVLDELGLAGEIGAGGQDRRPEADYAAHDGGQRRLHGQIGDAGRGENARRERAAPAPAVLALRARDGR